MRAGWREKSKVKVCSPQPKSAPPKPVAQGGSGSATMAGSDLRLTSSGRERLAQVLARLRSLQAASVAAAGWNELLATLDAMAAGQTVRCLRRTTTPRKPAAAAARGLGCAARAPCGVALPALRGSSPAWASALSRRGCLRSRLAPWALLSLGRRVAPPSRASPSAKLGLGCCATAIRVFCPAATGATNRRLGLSPPLKRVY